MSDTESDDNVLVEKGDHQSKGKSSKTRHYESFNIYIKEILNNIVKDFRIKRNSRKLINIFIDKVCTEVITNASKIVLDSGRTNMTPGDIKTATLLIFPQKLGQDCIEYANKKLLTYTQYEKGDSSKPISKQIKAGLIMPVSRIRTKIEHKIYKKKQIRETTPVMLAGIIECLVVRILESTCTVTKDVGANTITNNHIREAVCNNSDFLDLLLGSLGIYFCNNQISVKEDTCKFKNSSPKKPKFTDDKSIEQ